LCSQLHSQIFFKFTPKASRALRVLLLLQQSDIVPAFMHEEITCKIVSTVTDDDLSGCGGGGGRGEGPAAEGDGLRNKRVMMR
jgi:hypothetical protein